MGFLSMVKSLTPQPTQGKREPANHRPLSLQKRPIIVINSVCGVLFFRIYIVFLRISDIFIGGDSGGYQIKHYLREEEWPHWASPNKRTNFNHNKQNSKTDEKTYRNFGCSNPGNRCFCTD
jgi:hypothetical protein